MAQRQGPHHEAQKSTSVYWSGSIYCDSFTVLPVGSVSSISLYDAPLYNVFAISAIFKTRGRRTVSSICSAMRVSSFISSAVRMKVVFNKPSAMKSDTGDCGCWRINSILAASIAASVVSFLGYSSSNRLLYSSVVYWSFCIFSMAKALFTSEAVNSKGVKVSRYS